MKRKSFSLIHFIMIVIISLSSFMMFQNDLRSEKEYHSSMINKVFQGKAKFITKPNLEHRILKGKIKIGKKLYTYIYNIHASKNIEIKNVSEFLFQKLVSYTDSLEH